MYYIMLSSKKKQIGFNAPIVAEISPKIQQNVKKSVLGELNQIDKKTQHVEKTGDLKPWEPCPQQKELASALKRIPESWDPIPVNNKVPIGEDWQYKDFTREETLQWVTTGFTLTSKAGKQYKLIGTGIGLRTGNGILVFDIDATAEDCEATRFFNRLIEPYKDKTAVWTSGKPGRYAIAFAIPDELLPTFEGFTRRAIKFHDGSQVEIRYERCQCLIPPSYHPQTGSYRWINETYDLAPLSGELLELTLTHVKSEASKAETSPKPTGFKKSVNLTQKQFDRSVSIVELLSDRVKLSMESQQTGDRSCEMAAFAKEVFGWENWLNNQNIGASENFPKLINDVANTLQVSHKLEAVLNKVDRDQCVPGLYHKQGELGCWEKFKAVYPDIFQEIAPEHIKESLPKKIDGFYVYEVGGKKFRSRKILNKWNLDDWLNSQKYTADITINSPEFEYPKNLQESGAIIAVNSGLGTGKTQASISRAKSTQDTRIEIMSARNKLLHQIIEESDKKGLKVYHLNEDSDHDLVENESANLALCLESVHKLQGHSFAGADLYIDEPVAAFNQVLGGGTVKGSKQGLCLAVLREKLAEFRNIYLLDGNLNDETCELVKKLAPNKKLIKILNTSQSRTKTFNIIQTVEVDPKTGELKLKQRDKSPILSAISYAERPWIVTDSKNGVETIDCNLYDEGKFGYALNSETAEETYEDRYKRYPHPNFPENKRFSKEKWSDDLLKDPKKFFDVNKVDYFIASPTIENGFSYIGEYFTHQFAIFSGVLTVNGIVQMLFRNRDNSIPCDVFCPITSMIPRENGTITGELLKQQYETLFEETQNIYENRGTHGREIAEKARARMDLDWFDYADSLDITRSFEQKNLQACLVYKLEESGHTVNIVQEYKQVEVNKLYKETKKGLDKERSKEIFDALPFIDQAEKEAAKKSKPGRDTYNRIIKTYLTDIMPGICDEEIWNEDFVLKWAVKDSKALQNRVNGLLLYNPDIRHRINDSRDYNKLTADHIVKTSLIDVNAVKLDKYQKAGVIELIDKLKKGLKINKKSPEILNLMKWFRNYGKIKELEVPHKQKDGKEIIPWMKKILDFVGYKLSFIGKKVIDGVETREYGFDETDQELKERIIMDECILRGLKRKAGSEAIVNWEPETPITYPQELKDHDLSQEDIEDVSVLTIAKQLIENTCNCVNEKLLTKATKLLAALENHTVQMYVRTIDALLIESYTQMNPF